MKIIQSALLLWSFNRHKLNRHRDNYDMHNIIIEMVIERSTRAHVM